ncbi:sensor histidine kinase [Virgisporangium aurantiacum]|uniref:histidine kinase n=1 Tax=Virgisporangium aurantiacum TaxID=175570 RepID=A0A8J3Z495_9ACTN|nr:sensor domain-containing protein [Virgisporangium aurantiacum]GIJ56013.1 histidine kinase [Virgisporangium aurantiacum]
MAWDLKATSKRLLYALTGGPLALLGLAFALLVLLPGLVASLTLIGLPWLAVGVRAARGPAAAHRWLVRVLLGDRIEAPPRPKKGFLAALTDAPGWRALAYLVLRLPSALLATVVTAFLCFEGLVAALYPIWSRFTVFPSTTDENGAHLVTLTIDDWTMPEWLYVTSAGVAGLLMLAAAPWVARALILPDRLLARALLRPTRASRLRQTRTQAMDDSAKDLRRIERDLHDGAQTQLVALALALGMARDELVEGDADAALRLVDTAHQGAKQALAELRDLVRGIHPPALDTGLRPALQTLSARSTVPVSLNFDLPDRPSPAIETIAYYTAAELLANVAKHSGARRAVLSIQQTRPGWLRLTVRDDGIGGARAAPGGGLAGLTQRAGTVDGRLELVSPPGGPTVVTMELPVQT